MYAVDVSSAAGAYDPRKPKFKSIAKAEKDLVQPLMYPSSPAMSDIIFSSRYKANHQSSVRLSRASVLPPAPSTENTAPVTTVAIAINSNRDLVLATTRPRRDSAGHKVRPNAALGANVCFWWE